MPWSTGLLRSLDRQDRAAPFVLPAPADALAEWWARRGPRTRAALLVVGLVLVAVTAAGVARPPTVGPTVDVWVATTTVPAGQPVVGSLARVTRPVATLPDDVLPTDTAPTGVLTTALLPRQVLTAAHLAADVTSMLADDEVAVAVAADAVAPVATGRHVTVLAVGVDGVGRTLAHGVQVLAAADGWLWLAVPSDVAADVAAADAGGRLGLARER